MKDFRGNQILYAVPVFFSANTAWGAKEIKSGYVQVKDNCPGNYMLTAYKRIYET